MAATHNIFTIDNINHYCDTLAKKDKHIKAIIKQYGYPKPIFRKPSFQSLVHIILDQQVSIASAKSAFLKLKEATNNSINPTTILLMSDEALKACYFSRQKIIYVKGLAQAIVDKKLQLTKLANLPDHQVRTQLCALKGIGNWTVDVYLMFCLQRLNLFPIGDIALVNSIKHQLNLPKATTKEEILAIATKWEPLQSVATLIFWHAYIIRKGIILDF